MKLQIYTDFLPLMLKDSKRNLESRAPTPGRGTSHRNGLLGKKERASNQFNTSLPELCTGWYQMKAV